MKKINLTELMLFILFSSFSYSQVGIGTNAPDDSAILDVTSTNKGLLAPRIALTGVTDATTISNPANGLLVYSTGTGGLDYIGYVYWTGTEWVSLTKGAISNGTIEALNCSGAILTPALYTSGTAYTGTLTVPYTGGNGGIYNAQTITTTNGLTATLQAGNFNIGVGDLVYYVNGTPTVSSPTSTDFAITIGGQTCTATVGDSAPAAEVTNNAYVGLIAGQETAGILAGNFKFRIKRRTGSTNTNGTSDTEIMYVGPNASVTLIGYTSALYGGNHYDSFGTNICGPSETATRNTNVITKDVWYGFGDPGILTGSVVEKRQYTFMTDDATDNTFYRIEWTGVDTTPTTPAGDPFSDMKVAIFAETVIGE